MENKHDECMVYVEVVPTHSEHAVCGEAEEKGRGCICEESPEKSEDWKSLNLKQPHPQYSPKPEADVQGHGHPGLILVLAAHFCIALLGAGRPVGSMVLFVVRIGLSLSVLRQVRIIRQIVMIQDGARRVRRMRRIAGTGGKNAAATAAAAAAAA